MLKIDNKKFKLEIELNLKLLLSDGKIREILNYLTKEQEKIKLYYKKIINTGLYPGFIIVFEEFDKLKEIMDDSYFYYHSKNSNYNNNLLNITTKKINESYCYIVRKGVVLCIIPNTPQFFAFYDGIITLNKNLNIVDVEYIGDSFAFQKEPLSLYLKNKKFFNKIIPFLSRKVEFHIGSYDANERVFSKLMEEKFELKKIYEDNYNILMAVFEKNFPIYENKNLNYFKNKFKNLNNLYLYNDLFLHNTNKKLNKNIFEKNKNDITITLAILEYLYETYLKNNPKKLEKTENLLNTILNNINKKYELLKEDYDIIVYHFYLLIFSCPQLTKNFDVLFQFIEMILLKLNVVKLISNNVYLNNKKIKKILNSVVLILQKYQYNYFVYEQNKIITGNELYWRFNELCKKVDFVLSGEKIEKIFKIKEVNNTPLFFKKILAKYLKFEFDKNLMNIKNIIVEDNEETLILKFNEEKDIKFLIKYFKDVAENGVGISYYNFNEILDIINSLLVDFEITDKNLKNYFFGVLNTIFNLDNNNENILEFVTELFFKTLLCKNEILLLEKCLDEINEKNIKTKNIEIDLNKKIIKFKQFFTKSYKVLNITKKILNNNNIKEKIKLYFQDIDTFFDVIFTEENLKLSFKEIFNNYDYKNLKNFINNKKIFDNTKQLLEDTEVFISCYYHIFNNDILVNKNINSFKKNLKNKFNIKEIKKEYRNNDIYIKLLTTKKDFKKAGYKLQNCLGNYKFKISKYYFYIEYKNKKYAVEYNAIKKKYENILGVGNKEVEYKTKQELKELIDKNMIKNIMNFFEKTKIFCNLVNEKNKEKDDFF